MIPSILGGRRVAANGPSMSFNFLESDIGIDQRIVCSGGVNGMRVNSAGILVPSSGAPRLNYNPMTLAARGLLIEEPRTNTILSSGNVGGSGWATVNGSLAGATKTAPDGTTAVTPLVAGNTLAAGRVVQTTASFTAGVPYTLSLWLAPFGRTSWQVFIPATAFSDATARNATFTLTSTGAASPSGSGATAAIEQWPNGWYRGFLTFTPTITGTAQLQIRDPATGDGVNGAYIWGVQLEPDTTATTFGTSLIPTGASAVTRSVDNHVLPALGAAGTCYVEFAVPFLVSTAFSNNGIFEIDDGSFANSLYVYLQSAGNIGFGVNVGNVSQGAIGTATGAVTAGSVNKFAFSWNAAGALAMSLNGATVIAGNASSMPTTTRAILGEVALNQKLNGWMRRCDIYPTPYVGKQLQALSA